MQRKVHTIALTAFLVSRSLTQNFPCLLKPEKHSKSPPMHLPLSGQAIHDSASAITNHHLKCTAKQHGTILKMDFFVYCAINVLLDLLHT